MPNTGDRAVNPIEAVLALTLLAASGHVGSPDAWYEGAAGPFPVLVHVEVPQVIPGIAVVNVRVDGDAVTRVTAVADHADATGGATPPERAEAVEGLSPSRALEEDKARYLEQLGDRTGAAGARRRAGRLPPAGARDRYLLGTAHARAGMLTSPR